jgi:two-component system cell cycle sensor histidine kinase/response regulator CckA
LTDPRLAPDRLPVLLWTTGPDGACDYLNVRWTEFTGRQVADMLGWKWGELVHPEDRDRMMGEYTASVAAREPIRLEFRMLHQDGEYRWLLGTGEPIHDAEGRFVGFGGCVTDVTDRRALEQRLAQEGRTAEIAQLAGGIAHDFNNLLTGILGHVSLLLDESSLSPEAREDLDQIRRAADRAATLSRHLLAFSRRPPALPRSLNLTQLVSATTSAMRQVLGSAIELSLELDAGLEPVLADASQVEQFLIQLAAHGRKSMLRGGRLQLRTGRVEVDASRSAEQPGLRAGSYGTLEVTHTGPGMDVSAIEGAARQSGGHVDVRTAPNGEIALTLFLPRLTAPAEMAKMTHEGSETILLVEDDLQVREVGRRALERAGYTVIATGDAETAIAAADRHPGHIHLLITDVVLPRANGRELAARLAIHRPAIKVLYVSGTSYGVIARHRMLEPGIEFLEKPFELDALLRKVRQILGVDLSAEDATPWARSLV